MNERLTELYRSCRPIEALASQDQFKSANVLLGTEVEKFAELIVRECIDLASKEQKRYASITHRNMSECAVALGNFSLLIKDHFEDEE